MKERFFVLGMVLTLLAGAGSARAGVLYAVDDGTDSLYIIDTVNGGATLVGALGVDASYSGLAYDSSTGTMYISDVYDSASGTYGLGSLDLGTGAVTYIGSHVNSLDIMALAYDPANDVLYGLDNDNDCLATIDRATGVSTCVGGWVNTTDLRGLAFDETTGTLYAINATNLYTVDPATGQATLVGPLGFSPGNYMGLDVDPDTGTMWAAGSVDQNLYSIDKATGAATQVTTTGLDTVSGLATAYGMATAIPVLGGFGLVLLMGFVAVAGMLVIRIRI